MSPLIFMVTKSWESDQVMQVPPPESGKCFYEKSLKKTTHPSCHVRHMREAKYELIIWSPKIGSANFLFLKIKDFISENYQCLWLSSYSKAFCYSSNNWLTRHYSLGCLNSTNLLFIVLEAKSKFKLLVRFSSAESSLWLFRSLLFFPVLRRKNKCSHSQLSVRAHIPSFQPTLMGSFN